MQPTILLPQPPMPVVDPFPAATHAGMDSFCVATTAGAPSFAFSAKGGVSRKARPPF